MLTRLSRDYWPSDVLRPLLRVVMAFVFAPVVVSGILLLCLFGMETVLSGDMSYAAERAVGLGPLLLVATYVILLSAGLVTFLLLWSLQQRSHRAYLLAGLLLGVLAGLGSPVIGGPPTALPLLLVLAFYFGLLMLVFRWIAGVRRVDI